ncbi:MAG: hypothetical protein ACK4UN_09920 [Limisphaerales bacterium]
MLKHWASLKYPSGKRSKLAISPPKGFSDLWVMIGAWREEAPRLEAGANESINRR